MFAAYLSAAVLLLQTVHGSSLKQPVSRDGDAHLPVRVKRDLSSFFVCPKMAASGDEFSQMSEMILYSPITREDVVISYGLDGWTEEELERLTNNGFDSTRPTLLFSHGFRQSGNDSWLLDVRTVYDTMFSVSKEPTFNLLIYDWSSHPKYRYWASVSYLPFLGSILGEFIEMLGKYRSYDLDKLHLISHSLSTHIAGLASRQVASNYAPIGQLTALDPTGVCFQDNSQFGQENSLRYTDAKLVVSRHYNMDGFGAKRLIGGLDILINGGRKQPDNDDTQLITQGSALNLMARRDHHRAAVHEAQAFNEQCHEIAYECESYEAYLQGLCADCGHDGSKCYLVNNFSRLFSTGQGDMTKLIPRYAPGTKMFLKTHYEEPFCLHHYQLIARLNPNSANSTRALLSTGHVEFYLDNDHIARLHGSVEGDRFTALASSRSRLESLREPSLRVRASNSTTLALLGSLDYIELNYMSHWSAKERLQASHKLCSSPSKDSLVWC